MTINEAKCIANDWYDRTGKHPKLCNGIWRWMLPEPGKEDTTSELPPEVFNRLRSTERHPWLFDDRRVAVLKARIAATRAILAEWKPTVALCILLLFTASAAADFDIDRANMIKNPDTLCVWTSLETLGRHHGIGPLIGLTERKRAAGNANLDQARTELRRLGVRHWWTIGDLAWLREASERRLGAVVALVEPGAKAGHAVVVVDYGERVRFHDTSDCKTRTVSREWFDRRVAWLIVVEK